MILVDISFDTAVHESHCSTMKAVLCVQDAPSSAVPTLPVFRAAAELSIPGLHMFPDFVSEDEEAFLLQSVDNFQWRLLAKRSVLHFGYAFEYLVCDWMTPHQQLPKGSVGPTPGCLFLKTDLNSSWYILGSTTAQHGRQRELLAAPPGDYMLLAASAVFS